MVKEFKTLKAKIEFPKEKEISVCGTPIKVKSYLPSADKRDLILISLQQSVVDNIINPYYLDVIFYVNLVRVYTDLVFAKEDLDDVFELYDKLKLSGVLDSVLKEISEKELKELINYITDIKAEYDDYQRSAVGVVNGLLKELPKNTQAAKEALESYDPNTIQEIIELAKTVGFKGKSK